MGKRETREWRWAMEHMKTNELDTCAFEAVWCKWVTFRRVEVGVAVTETVAKRTIRKLEQWGEQRAIAAIRHSMTEGWQGIYEGGTLGARRSPTRIASAPGKYDNVRIHRK